MGRTFNAGQACHLCDRPMVSRYTARDDMPPGHVPHKGNGHCYACYSRLWNARQEDINVSEWLREPLVIVGHHDPDPRVRADSQALQELIDDRRARGIPTEGLHS